MPPDSTNLSTPARALLRVFEEEKKEKNEEKMVVNQLVSKVASFYEKFRTAMDYGSEETIPRRAIERMLKRMLVLEQHANILAQDLVRELVWAGYLPNATVPEGLIEEVSQTISLYQNLKEKIGKKKVISTDALNEFIIQTLSCEILQILIPNREKNAVANFMFKNLRESVAIEDDSEQTRDIQVFIAVRKSFGRDDVPFLRYRLFKEIFGKLSNENLDQVAEDFEKGYKEIKYQLSYPQKEKVVNHIKKKAPPFFILYDLLLREKGKMEDFINDEEEFKKESTSFVNHVTNQSEKK